MRGTDTEDLVVTGCLLCACEYEEEFVLRDASVGIVVTEQT